jgi:GNAT superfamily N-acetyltransferase
MDNNRLAIRPAQASDAPLIAELLRGVVHYFLADPSAAGAEGFLSTISQAAIAGYIGSPDFIYVMGMLEGELAGVAALKENKHVYHLFVHPRFHRLGIARQLWLHLKEKAMAGGNPGIFTVNSTVYAAPVYERFGFKPTGPVQTKSGVQFQPMQFMERDK